MTIKFNPTTRKALAKAAADILETQAKYLGVPSCAYQIGELTLQRDGTLEGDIPFGLLTALVQQGFLPEATEEPEAEAEPAAEPEAQAEGLDEPEPCKTFHLITPRGTLLCQERFDTPEEAEAAGYGNYFYHEGVYATIKTPQRGRKYESKNTPALEKTTEIC